MKIPQPLWKDDLWFYRLTSHNRRARSFCYAMNLFVRCSVLLSLVHVAQADSRRLMMKMSKPYHKSPKMPSPKVTFNPGNFDWGYYIRDQNGNRVRVANGLTGRAIGYVGEPVVFADGTNSSIPLHSSLDGGGIFTKEDGSGYYYVSNSEEGNAEDMEFTGGAYVMELDLDHNPVDYYQVLSGTVDNCAGGKTPWGTWVSCEEEDGYGRCWQVDPANKDQTGATVSQVTNVTGYPGNWEAFAWDDGDSPPRGYVTEDGEPEDAPGAYGALTRFTPDEAALACYAGATKAEKWCTLNSGTHDYLKLEPQAGGSNCGTISWVSDPADSSSGMYRGGEGIDITDGIMIFVAKVDRQWFEVDLRSQTYCQWSTLPGFPQEPDNIRVFGGVTYFNTDGNTPNGVYARDSKGFYGLFMEIDYDTETAGVDISPDGMYMYVSFQDNAMWQFWRMDGYPFDGPTSGKKYIKDDGLLFDQGFDD